MAYSGVNQVRRFLKQDYLCDRCKKLKPLTMVACGTELLALYCVRCFNYLSKKGFIK